MNICKVNICFGFLRSVVLFIIFVGGLCSDEVLALDTNNQDYDNKRDSILLYLEYGGMSVEIIGGSDYGIQYYGDCYNYAIHMKNKDSACKYVLLYQNDYDKPYILKTYPWYKKIDTQESYSIFVLSDTPLSQSELSKMFRIFDYDISNPEMKEYLGNEVVISTFY